MALPRRRIAGAEATFNGVTIPSDLRVGYWTSTPPLGPVKSSSAARSRTPTSPRDPSVPVPVWGRKELSTGEMWNSTSTR